MPSPVDTVAAILEGYASRGVFRGFSRRPARASRADFKMLWHRDRMFELTLDTRLNRLRFPSVLPQVPPRSSMYREFRQFVDSRQAKTMPEHRRIDPAKVTLECGNKAGHVSLACTALDGDLDYATRKLIGLVHEIYLVFLLDGRYYDYMVDVFDLDPDRM